MFLTEYGLSGRTRSPPTNASALTLSLLPALILADAR